MADEEEKLLSWDNKLGLGTILNGIMVITIVGSLIAAWGSMRTATDNSAIAIDRLNTLIIEVQKSNISQGERVTRVEEQSKAMANSLDRIERKVDQLSTKK